MIVNANFLMAAPQQTSTTTTWHKDLKVSGTVGTQAIFDLENATDPFGAGAIVMQTKLHPKYFVMTCPSVKLKVTKELALKELTKTTSVKFTVLAKIAEKFALAHMYADYRGLRIGKTSSSFGDPDACGLINGSPVQLQWQRALSPQVNIAVAMEVTPMVNIYANPNDEGGEAQETDTASSKLQPSIPTLSGHVRYNVEKRRHMQVSGLFRVLEYYTSSIQSIYIPVWGVNISATLHAIPEKTVLKLQSVYGHGIGDYLAELADLSKENNTVYAVTTTPGDDALAVYNTLNAWGIGTEVSHKWLPKWSSELSGRLVATLDSTRPQNAFQWGGTTTFKLSYHPTQQITLATNYLFAYRQNIKQDNYKDAHRVQVAITCTL